MLWMLFACGPAPDPVNLARDPDALRDVAVSEVRDQVPDAVPIELDAGHLALLGGQHVRIHTAPCPFPDVDRGFRRNGRPAGMTLKGPRALRWDGTGKIADSWSVQDGQVVLRLLEGVPTQGWSIAYTPAMDHERDRSVASSGRTPVEVVTGPVQEGASLGRGLLLPAPAQVTVDVALDRRMVLGTHLRLLPPQVGDIESDGASLQVLVDGALVAEHVATLEGEDLRIDLPVGASITLRTEPGDSTVADYVFVQEPAVYRPSRSPRRLVLIFVDTLRPDHMGMYGYERDTTPVLDAWAQDAAVFTNAHSPAPWTLPSARSALSGQPPDLWDPDTSLPAVLAQQGWLVHAEMANPFLRREYGMGEAWSTYEYRMLGNAKQQVNGAMRTLKQWPDRDVAVMVHLMEPHVPYDEPERFRDLWEGPLPKVLEGKSIGRDSLDAVRRKDVVDVQRYVTGRYDQNIRYADAHLERLLEQAGPDATVVLFSDHGEELLEHGDFEHGHHLWEELLRVPLVISGPGVTPGTYDEPVSLLDLTPTVLALLDAPQGERHGRSLVPLFQGQSVEPQPLGVGYTLYGRDRWGVIDGTSKYLTDGFTGRRIDLVADPLEENGERVPVEEWAELLAQGLGRPVHRVLMILGTGKSKRWVGWVRHVEISHPQGIERAWTVYDPISDLATPQVRDGVASVSPRDRQGMPRVIVVLPNDPDPTGLTVKLGRDTLTDWHTWDADAETLEMRSGRVRQGWAPGPMRDDLPQTDDVLSEQLELLGYIEH